MPERLTFVDTNVLVYAHDREAGVRHDEAVSIVEGLWDHGTGCLSTQVLQEFYVTVTRKLARAISREEARRVVTDYATWRVHQVAVPDIVAASSLEEEHTLSFWDALIVVAARRIGASTLLSEDLQTDRTFGELAVANPFTGRR